MPFHVRCTECKKMIAKGVRFNSIKKKCGRYLGTIIFQFDMKCPHCKNEIVIKTEPKSCEYLLVKGVIKYILDYDEEKIGTIKVQSSEEGEKMNRNAFYKIESQAIDLMKFNEMKPNLDKLIELQYKDENFFELNKKMRKRLKEEKKELEKKEQNKKEKCIDIELFDINSEDRKKALYTTFKAKNGKFKIRDTIRFDSLLSDNNNKILLNKKHRLDPKIQIALEKAQKVKDENEFEDTLKIKLNRKFKLKKIE